MKKMKIKSILPAAISMLICSNVLLAQNTFNDNLVLKNEEDNNWTKCTGSNKGQFYAFWSSSINDVFVAGQNGVIHSIDRGKNWNTVFTDLVTSLWGDSKNNLYAGGRGIYHSNDGKNWTKQKESSTIISGITSMGLNKVIAVSQTGDVYITENEGNDWVKTKLPIFRETPAVSNIINVSGSILIYGEMGIVLRSTDEGKTWKDIWFPTRKTIKSMWSPASLPNTVYAITNSDDATKKCELFRSSDKGATWKLWLNLPINSPYYPLSIFGKSNKDFYVTSFNALIHTKDGGISWSNSNLMSQALNQNGGIAGEDIYIIGAKDIYRGESMKTTTIAEPINVATKKVETKPTSTKVAPNKIDGKGIETTEVTGNYKLYPFSVEVAQKKLWGYKDRISEKVIINPKYTSCGTFNWGDYTEVEIDGKKGILYKSGKEICTLKYTQVYSDKNDGLFLVTTDKYGFIDSTGKEVIPLIYSTANPFNSGRAFVEINEKKFFINNKGKEIINVKEYEETKIYFSEGLCGVYKNKKWGFIDINGKLVTPLKYDYIEELRDGLAIVNIGSEMVAVNQGIEYIGGKWGYIDKTGKEVIALTYDAAKECSEGLAAVKSGEKWGFIDRTGKVVIPIIYDWISSSFINGTAEVYLKKENFKIDKTGNRVKEK